jgi:hypothetical protein
MVLTLWFLASCFFDPQHPNAPCNDTPSPPGFLITLVVAAVIVAVVWFLRRRSRRRRGEREPDTRFL